MLVKLTPSVKVVAAAEPDGVGRVVGLQHVTQVLDHHVRVIVSLKL
jgi:hypothetical protein